MKRLFILLACCFAVNGMSAQNLEGLWYSSDSTRIYEITRTAENKYMGVIKSSTRKTDKIGYVVVKDLTYNPRRKRFEGFIYAVKDGEAAFVKIKFNKKNKNEITLKIDRMFVFDVSIDWKRATAA